VTTVDDVLSTAQLQSSDGRYKCDADVVYSWSHKEDRWILWSVSWLTAKTDVNVCEWTRVGCCR